MVSRLNISFDHMPPVTIFPVRTPIEPVREPGRATIQLAGVETQYPPDPATGPIATTSGFRARVALCRCAPPSGGGGRGRPPVSIGLTNPPPPPACRRRPDAPPAPRSGLRRDCLQRAGPRSAV